MATTTVSQFALELKMPASALLEQLNKAGVTKVDGDNSLTDQDKTKLFDYLRHSQANGQKKVQVILRRKQPVGAPDLTKSDSEDLGLTQQHLAFLQRLGVPLDKVFNAEGMGPSVYGPKMRALGKWVAFNTSGCHRRHELRLKDRAGHCIQCHPQYISYQRRHDEDGIVYIAYSPCLKLVKVGTTQRSDRVDQLNSYQYGGASDWRKHHSYPCANAGKVESTAHNLLSQYKAEGQYFKNGGDIDCGELFNCDVAKAVEAVERALAQVAGKVLSANTTSRVRASNSSPPMRSLSPKPFIRTAGQPEIPSHGVLHKPTITAEEASSKPETSSLNSTTDAATDTPRKAHRGKPFQCPVCRHEIRMSPPTICPNCKTGIPRDVRGVSLIWSCNSEGAPDRREGNDGRHIADD